MEGWVYKLGDRIKNWKKRWLRTEGLTLKYFVNQHGACKKWVPAADILDVQGAPECEYQPAFKVLTPNRTFYFVAETDDMCDDWMNVVRHIIETDVCAVKVFSTDRKYTPQICQTFTSMANIHAILVDGKPVLMMFADGQGQDEHEVGSNVILGYITKDSTPEMLKSLEKRMNEARHQQPGVAMTVVCEPASEEIQLKAEAMAKKFNAYLSYSDLEDEEGMILSVMYIVRTMRVVKYQLIKKDRPKRRVSFIDYRDPFIPTKTKRHDLKKNIEVGIFGLGSKVSDDHIFNLKPQLVMYEASEIRLSKSIKTGNILEHLNTCDVPLLCLTDDNSEGIQRLNDLYDWASTREENFVVACFIHTGRATPVVQWEQVVEATRDWNCSVVEVSVNPQRNMDALWSQCVRRYFRRFPTHIIPIFENINAKLTDDALAVAFAALNGDPYVARRRKEKDFTDDLEELRKGSNKMNLNDWNIGEVIKSVDGVTMNKVVRKDDPTVIATVTSQSGTDMNYIFREMNVLKAVQHPCVVKYMGYAIEDEEEFTSLSVFAEYPENGSLDRAIDANALSKTEKLIVAIGISMGMELLHRIWITHRRLSPASVFLNAKNEPKISQFLRSGCDGALMSGRGGNPIYTAPEIVMGRSKGYTLSSDVYSFGMILYELMTGISLRAKKVVPLPVWMNNIDSGWRPDFPVDLEMQLQELIMECWDSSPAIRPTFADITKRLINMRSSLSDIDLGRVAAFIIKADPSQTTDELQEETRNTKNIDMGRYSIIALLQADGNPGKVKLAKDDATRENVVIRKFPKMTPDLERFFNAEIQVMSSVRHPCILSMIGYNMKDQTGKHALIVTDCAAKGTLEEALSRSNLLTPLDKINIIFGIACGLNALHSNNIVHRCLNTKTVMLNSHKLPLIRKFGYSCANGANAADLENTNSVFYTAPEVYDDATSYHTSIDIYSFGVIIYQVITGFPPTKGVEPGMIHDHIKRIKNNWRPEIPEGVDQEAARLIEACWSSDPAARPSAAGIMEKLRELKGQIIDGVDSDMFADFSSSLF